MLGNSILNGLSYLATVAGQIIETIWNVLKSLPGKALQWGKDMLQGFIDGIKGMIGNIKDTVENVANSIKEFLHFTRPDKGPLREYEKWMPDMIKGLSRTLKNSSPELYNASKKLAEEVASNFDISDIYTKMKNAVDLESAKMSADITSEANYKASKDKVKSISTDSSTTINNTQNFYEKNTTPYEQQKQARQQLRRLAYDL